MASRWKSRRRDPSGLVFRQADKEDSKEDWAVVLESWNGSRRIAAQFQGIPSGAC